MKPATMGTNRLRRRTRDSPAAGCCGSGCRADVDHTRENAGGYAASLRQEIRSVSLGGQIMRCGTISGAGLRVLSLWKHRLAGGCVDSGDNNKD